jgi:hypothetical protein
MATDVSLLMGEIIEDPTKQERDVEQLLRGFLKALIQEQQIEKWSTHPLHSSTSESQSFSAEVL